MDAIIAAVICIIAGLLFIGIMVYHRYFKNFVPNPEKWGRTRAKITGRHHYQEKNTSRHSTTPYRDCYEKSIVYTVDGVTYKKYVDDTENGAVHIYYKLKNPNVIRTVSEIKREKQEARNSRGFGMVIFFAAIPLITGVCILLTIIFDL
ncbi:MAG: hypothetical protein J6A41_08380 [Ruminiclostridium sp.]|nr:hypothetical protein [Ruminiclostridium sp.]